MLDHYHNRMKRPVFLMLVTVAATSAWIWLRRRGAFGRTLNSDRRPPTQFSLGNVLEGHSTELSGSMPIKPDNSQIRLPEAPGESNSPVSTLTQFSAIETGSECEIEVSRLQLAAGSWEIPAIAPVPEHMGILRSVDTLSTEEADAISGGLCESVQEFKGNLAVFDSRGAAAPRKTEIGGDTETSSIKQFIFPVMMSTDSADVISESEVIHHRSEVYEEPRKRLESDGEASANLSDKTPSLGGKAEVDAPPASQSKPEVIERPKKARDFAEPKPSPATKTARENTRSPGLTRNTDQAALPIQVQLIFGRGEVVKSLALILQRREGMPETLEISTSDGRRLPISESSEDSFESVPITEAELTYGIVFQAREGTQRWRWELTRREIYVLAAGDAFGLSGFVTRRKDQRLWLNTQHIVLVRETYRDEVILALDKAGCGNPEISDYSTVGVPQGWILIRGVTPTKAVPMLEERNILNVLCPSHEHEPQFVGGIRLDRNNWLLGFPPRIRFAGGIGDDFQVLIDNTPTAVAADGAFEAPGWDTEGEHRLWFGGRAETYRLCSMEENWLWWSGHTGASGKEICGASVCGPENTRWQQFCIPVTNPILIGARPGDVFRCRVPGSPQKKWMLTLVPFTPVWALPAGGRSPKSPVAAVLLEFTEPLKACDRSSSKFKSTSAIRKWGFAIRRAHRFRLKLDVESDEVRDLWLQYGIVAKKLRKQMR